ncbi:hypothetical protein K0U73_18480, partial [bacterium]|nr:hypothetical protein [bacterium]
WDDRSDPPMASWHRFDLVDSSYAMGLMAHRTPAWTEPYVAILDQLIARHTSWWSAADWLTQFGHDPDQANYPDAYRMFIPPELWGEYDTPGWTANGIEPYGKQMDPVQADGMLFYKGFFLVLLGIRSMIDSNDRWNEPFEMIRGQRFVLVDPLADRRPSVPTMACGADRLPLREHQNLAILTGWSWPRSEASRQPTRH